jgi:hypothetical protein
MSEDKPNLITELTAEAKPARVAQAAPGGHQFDINGIQYEHKRSIRMVWIVVVAAVIVSIAAFFVLGTAEGRKLFNLSGNSSSNTTIANSSNSETASSTSSQSAITIREFSQITDPAEITKMLEEDAAKVGEAAEPNMDYATPDWQLEFGIE